jgi:hypothetical protein
MKMRRSERRKRLRTGQGRKDMKKRAEQKVQKFYITVRIKTMNHQK